MLASHADWSRRKLLRVTAGTIGALVAGGVLEACSAPSGPASAPPTSAQSGGAAQTAPAQAQSAPAGGNRPKVAISQGATVAVSSPLWMADSTNAFAEHGIDASITLIRSDASTPALLNKQTDALVTSAGPALVADLNGGIDEVYIAAYANGNTVSLYGQPSIKGAEDLKGKLIATDRPGTPGDYYTRVALSLLGLTPSDVTILPLGSADVSLQALVSGQVNAAAFPPPFSFQAERAGFVDLQDTFDTPYLTNGVVVLRSRLDEMAMQYAAVVAAIRDGVNAFYAQPDLAMQTISKRTGEDDPAVLKKTYDFFNTKVRFDATLVPRPESLQGMLDFLAETTIPAAKNARPEQFIDTRFLK
jgi:ABC-type nitrate/sulfonate/bicarbonate transport system substrate-binding protein